MVRRTKDQSETVLEQFRAKATDNKGSGRWALRNWHGYFMDPGDNDKHNRWIRELAAKHVGPEITRWSDDVTNDKTHRYAQATLQSTLKERGGYLVYAYLKEPPKTEANTKGRDLLGLGKSRAVMVLTDLAIVEKKTSKGNLYFIADARSGAPVAGADVSILEMWNEYNRKMRKSEYHHKKTDLTTDEVGMSLFPHPDHRSSNIHLLVTAGDDRIAWSGMSYWYRYNPSR